MKTIFIALAAFAATLPAIGQTGNPTAPATVPRTVDLNVLVLDRDHHPVTELTNSAFTITEDGAPRTIQTVAAAEGPVSLCLLIDESGSTNGERGPIGEAAAALVKDLPAGSEVMVVRFSNAAYLDLPFTPASSVDPEKLTTLTSRGGTAMFDALVKAEINLLANAHRKRRAMVLITDGGDNASRLSGEQAMQRLIRSGAPFLYALSVPGKTEYREDISRDSDRLKKLFKIAGGFVLRAKNPNDLSPLVDEISEMIRSQYVLSFLPENIPDGTMHKLEAKINQLDKRDEIQTLSGFYYWGPRPQTTAK